MTTFNEIHPIACQLFNQDGRPWLYVSDEPDQQLTLEVSNASGRAMEWKPIFGEVSENNHHLVLKFRQGVLLHGTYDLKLSEVSAREWEATCSADGQLLYLIRIADDLSFPPDRAYEISLEYIAANVGRGANGTKVGLTTKGLSYSHGSTIDMQFDRTMYLGIVEEASVTERDASLKHASLLLNLSKGDEYGEGLAVTLADDVDVTYLDTAEKKYEYLLRLSYVAIAVDSDHFLRFQRNGVNADKSSKIYLSFHQQRKTEGEGQSNNRMLVREPDGWEVSNFEGDELRKPGWVFTPKDTVDLDVVGHDEDITAQRIEIPIRYLAEKEKGYFIVFYENVPGHFDGQQLLAIDLENNPPKKAIPILPYVHFQQPETEQEQADPVAMEDQETPAELALDQNQPETPEKAKEIQWTGELTGNLSLQTKIETNVTLTFRKSAPSGFKVKTSGDWTIVVPAEASSARMQVYKKEGQEWQLHQQLAAPKGTWGGGAALHGEWLAVTAHDAKGIGKIVFYQLQNDQWTETQSLSASKHNNWFGEQVALFEARAIVGAQMGGNLNTATGQATTYDLIGETWVKGELLASTTGKGFGKSVALNNNWALVGSQSLQGFQQENGQWQKKQELVNENAEKEQRFSALDASGDQLVAGAMADQGRHKQAFLFQEQNGQWQQIRQLQLPNDMDRPGLGMMNMLGQD